MAFIRGEGYIGGYRGDVIYKIYIVFIPDIVKGVGITIIGVIIGAIRTGCEYIFIIREI